MRIAAAGRRHADFKNRMAVGCHGCRIPTLRRRAGDLQRCRSWLGKMERKHKSWTTHPQYILAQSADCRAEYGVSTRRRLETARCRFQSASIGVRPTIGFNEAAEKKVGDTHVEQAATKGLIRKWHGAAGCQLFGVRAGRGRKREMFRV